MRQILLSCFFLLPLFVSAQDDCVCCDFRQRGQVEYNAGRYESAIEKWKRAQKASDAAQCPDLDQLIAKANAKIKQRDQAAAQRQSQNAELQRLRDKADDDLWDVLKDGDAADCDKYLAKYKTGGRHTKDANDRKKALTSPPSTSPSPPLERGAGGEADRADNVVLIPGGTFQMGDQFDDYYSNEAHVHSVTLSSFYLSKTEVTFDEYDAFCTATGRAKPSDNNWGRGRRPVINVSWYDAVEYCNWLSGREGLKPIYAIDKSVTDPNNQNSSDNIKWKVSADWSANGYRLPTEAEWEYAARQGGQKVRFGNGRDVLDPSEINFNASALFKEPYSIVGEDRGKTVPVDQLSANSLGLRHMSGNVCEWCWDWHDEAYYYNQSDGARNPSGPSSGKYRCLRGGSFGSGLRYCRASGRGNESPNGTNYSFGFRVVRH